MQVYFVRIHSLQLVKYVCQLGLFCTSTQSITKAEISQNHAMFLFIQKYIASMLGSSLYLILYIIPTVQYSIAQIISDIIATLRPKLFISDYIIFGQKLLAMKKKPQTQISSQSHQEKVETFTPKEMQELMALKAQLKELKHRNELIENQIRNVAHSNNLKKNTNNVLRTSFKKLHEQIEMLNKEHLLKVEQNLKNQEGPVSALIKDNGFGLSPFALMKIPAFRYEKKLETDICMGCYQQLQNNSKCKSLPGCDHIFHSRCVDQYLLVSKQCPACGQDVLV